MKRFYYFSDVPVWSARSVIANVQISALIALSISIIFTALLYRKIRHLNDLYLAKAHLMRRSKNGSNNNKQLNEKEVNLEKASQFASFVGSLQGELACILYLVKILVFTLIFAFVLYATVNILYYVFVKSVGESINQKRI